MVSRESIRAVYADPQVDGIKHLYHEIGAMLKEGVDFDRAYALVVQSGGESSLTWIRFCVQSVSRFTQPPEESEFLAALEEFCRQEVDA
tara:strand:+ start:266 stop:532 length:267 start_codon:yes stop_codon:yes gene_type:complete